jgi:hypothetical protein
MNYNDQKTKMMNNNLTLKKAIANESAAWNEMECSINKIVAA